MVRAEQNVFEETCIVSEAFLSCPESEKLPKLKTEKSNVSSEGLLRKVSFILPCDRVRQRLVSRFQFNWFIELTISCKKERLRHPRKLSRQRE